MTFAPPPWPPPGWYDDPWQLAPQRWWDGRAWSWQIRDRPAPPADAPTVPIEAGLWGLLAITAVMVGLHVVAALIARHLPAVPAIVLVTAALYGPMAAFCIYASRRWASSRLSTDYGARVRPIDVALGLAAFLVAIQAEGVTALIVQALRIPTSSNVDRIRSDDVYITLAAVAIIAAPLIEELFFRGLLLSALRSRLAPVPAIATQAVVFGAYHAAPVYGWGNIGLVVILSVVGAVFGATAHLTRRLGAGMIAHALLNGLVFAVLLARD